MVDFILLNINIFKPIYLNKIKLIIIIFLMVHLDI